MKLNLIVYGLCDSPRIQYLSVKGVLLKSGALKSKFAMTSLQVYSVAMLMISSGEEEKFLNPTLSIKSSSQVHPEELENFK